MAITINGSGITSANIADGTITSSDLANTYLTPTGDGSSLTNMAAGGKVLQVVQLTNTTMSLITATGWTAVHSGSFTPLSATSKLLIRTVNNARAQVRVAWHEGYGLLSLRHNNVELRTSGAGIRGNGGSAGYLRDFDTVVMEALVPSGGTSSRDIVVYARVTDSTGYSIRTPADGVYGDEGEILTDTITIMEMEI